VFVGLATVDLIHRVAEPVGVDEKDTALSQEIVAGGPAANAAVTFALLGGDAVLITDLGLHPLAELTRRDLATYGVSVRAVEPDHPAPPAVSSIRVLDGTGERSVVSVNAAARTADAPGWLPAVLDDADVLLLDGHHPALAMAAARAAAESGVPVVLDAGSWKPVLDELLPLVDVAICSADFRVPDHVDVMTALLARGVRGVAVSAGGEPLRWSLDGERGDVAAPQVRVRDTLGAGDVLHGAFAWELTGDDDTFDRRLARAGDVASQRCTFTGISSWRNHLLRRAGDWDAEPVLRRSHDQETSHEAGRAHR
jgi:sugar/nucleoside kinase (ribokinase family)